MSSLRSGLRTLGRAAALRPEARAFAARAWLGAPLVELSLALVGLGRTLAWIDAIPTRRDAHGTPVSVGEGQRLVGGAYRAHALRGRCLSRSLVQYLLHRRDGTKARFVVGVRRPGVRQLDAHAWVEGVGCAASDSVGTLHKPEQGFESILVNGDRDP